MQIFKNFVAVQGHRLGVRCRHEDGILLNIFEGQLVDLVGYFDKFIIGLKPISLLPIRQEVAGLSPPCLTCKLGDSPFTKKTVPE